MPICRQLAPRFSGPSRLLVAALVLLAPFLPAQTPDLTQPKSLIRQNNFPAAEQMLRSTLAANPRSPDTLYLLAFVLHRENKPQDSLALYTAAAALQAPTPDDLRIVALDYVLLHDFPDALHWLDRALAADPRNPEALYARGRVHMERGDFLAAERDFRSTLALNPTDVKALNNLGLSLEAQNRTDEALTAYRKAIAAQNEDQAQSLHKTEQPLLNLGALLNTRTRSAEAIPPLEAAIALAPGCPKCHEELARAFLATHQDAPATREMQQAIALDPQNPRLHFQLGQIYRRAGLTAQADAELKTSATLYGSHSTPQEQ